MWEEELAGMRERIKRMREALVAAAGRGRRASRTWASSPRQKGMFSYSGLSEAQMQRLRSEFGVYGVDSGRICVAALNERNIDAVAAAIAKVMLRLPPSVGHRPQRLIRTVWCALARCARLRVVTSGTAAMGSIIAALHHASACQAISVRRQRTGSCRPT